MESSIWSQHLDVVRSCHPKGSIKLSWKKKKWNTLSVDMMSSYQLVTEVWLGTKWKAKHYPPTKERVSELVTGGGAVLWSSLSYLWLLVLLLKWTGSLLRFGCQGPTKNQVFGQCSHHATPFGENCGPWRMGLAGKIGALGNTRDSHLSVSSAAPPDQSSLPCHENRSEENQCLS